MAAPAILTTVVGSYPIPAWLAAFPTATALRDAILVVLKTQELAGLDVIADGELSRFDVNHPETNGMIDYFIRPMTGIHTSLSREELARFRAAPGMKFRTQPAGVVREHQIAAAPADLQANGISSVRVERIRHRRLPNPAALQFLPPQQAVRLQTIDDDRDGLRRQSCQPRHFCLGQAIAAPGQRQQ